MKFPTFPYFQNFYMTKLKKIDFPSLEQGTCISGDKDNGMKTKYQTHAFNFVD